MAGCAAAAAFGSSRGDVNKLMFELLHVNGDQTVMSLGLNFSVNLFSQSCGSNARERLLPDGTAVCVREGRVRSRRSRQEGRGDPRCVYVRCPLYQRELNCGRRA